ncbi:hypothetical protein HPB52_002112 [Rhipicephalus sanguineus]|uniref:Alpha-1,4-N-acetylglucosaminyltransferase n=1 Tax=Rhipicephalus sanguineus TaxID=34632 RepID=A0A9D4QC03_RHISA|nr:hypothetical protein HPB52_002112 [Rhipicephalus sanguineus]
MESPETRHFGGSAGGVFDGVPPSRPMIVPILETKGGARTPARPATTSSRRYPVPVVAPVRRGCIDGNLGQKPKARGRLPWDCVDPRPLILLLAGAYVGVLYAGSPACCQPKPCPVLEEHRPKSFYDTDGYTGYSYDIVPDIVHLVRYNQTDVNFVDVLSFRSMYINHRPKKIYVHCSPCGFTGNYTRLLAGINFTFISTVFPQKIFNIAIQERYHSTDVARLRVLLRYGGIYLDRDVFVVQSLRRYLRYEATISCPTGASLGNMVMIFHKNSRFLRLYLNTYRQLNDSVWYYNAGVVPTVALIEPHAHLVNRVKYGLETGMDMLGVLYEPHAYPYWRNAFAVHLLAFHRAESPHDPLRNADLNETNIRDLDNAMGQMARSVIFGTSDFVPPDAPVRSVAELVARKDRGENLAMVRPGNERPFFEPVLSRAK